MRPREQTQMSCRSAVERLRGIDWVDDAAAYEHANSRALLMREYLRRTAEWAEALGDREGWPFFDLAERVAPGVALAPEVEAALDEVLVEASPASLRQACRAAVRWAALREAGTELPSGPSEDPYEPLLLMCERGGGYFIEQFIDLNGVMVPLGTVDSNLSTPPFPTLAPSTLDALDGEGAVTYYATIDEGHPRGLVRRRTDEDEAFDEAFTRNLRWEPTEYLRLYDLGHNEIDHVEITAAEAARFIEDAVRRLSAA
ncbi:hypothetical protein SGM_1565 [Streptomyces griseoaurantiacus M045]|uniref:Uncharacterized protein n=1 Tax=Streptomyces griseoaurantiacus M045 TaxID=996637 RepID=F3NEK1_9ACTN|nr:hypothetical protein [Streptomyces griseoaurantiacus]EGG48270.1 hypothetical protein SGM_1565 [Streptomyces griseoaurantiacus M045]